MKKYSYVAVLLSAALFASCEESEKKQASDSTLSIRSAKVDQVARASKSSFVEGDEIGVYVLDASGNAYDQSGGCLNNKATLSSEWHMEKEVTLTDEIGTVYAYSPYASLVSDLKQIPVQSSTQTDYLYAVPTAATAVSSKIALRMKHALSLVKFVIKKDGYVGEGHITEVSLKGIGLSGFMDATTGAITTKSSGNERYEGDFYLDATTPLTLGIIAFPQPISATTAVITIDGDAYSYKLTSSNWQEGKETTYTLEINTEKKTFITVGSATIDDWELGGSYQGGLVDDGIDIGTEI